MNRREALKTLAGAGFLSVLPMPLLAKESAARGSDLLPQKKFVVGHRGACAYAPENTLESYRLAMKQGAEFVEQDLQITRDGVLVCCHDLGLNRVSNVAEVFPDRFKEVAVNGAKTKEWRIHDFTVAEIKQLDAGERFDPKFKGAKIPTWQEAIDEIKGKANFCPETKGPEYYGKLGFNMEALVIETLKKNGLDKPRRGSSSVVLIQSFSKAGLKKLVSEYKTKWPLLWLTSAKTEWTTAMLDEAEQFAAVIGPFKEMVTKKVVEESHVRGIKVVPYTFRAVEKTAFKNVGEEMEHYLSSLNVDGMFTDNPDLFPRRK